MTVQHYGKFEAILVASRAEIDTLKTYEDNLEEYREKNLNYLLLPFDGKYYDLINDELNDISDEQWVDTDAITRDVIDLLVEFPFMLVKNHRNHSYLRQGDKLHPSWEASEGEPYEGPQEVIEKAPELIDQMVDIKQRHSGYRIITPAELNTRNAKEMMFAIIAELENKFARIIKSEYEDSEKLFSEVSPRTIGRWKKAGLGDFQMHITEYMTLSEMQKVIAKSEALYSKCGFDSRNQFDRQMSGIVDLRNRVMHPNRTIIHHRGDVEQLRDRLSRVEELT